MTARKKPPVRAAVKRRRFRIMPFTISMLALLLMLKLNDIYFNVQSIRDARAEEKAEEHKEDAGHGETAKDEEHKGDAKKEESGHEEEAKKEGEHAADGDKKEDEHKEEAKEEGHDDEKKDDGHGEEEAKEEGGHGGGHGDAKPAEEPKTAGAGKMTVKEVEALKAKSQAPLYTKDEIDLLQNLTKRRQELEQREQELVIKSKVLEATEKRIADKINEMKSLETELAKAVEAYNKQQESQIGSLVKIYENMKPGDAANIFNEMDMPILLEVIGKMSERKVAPVLANMSPKKARDVTQELAEIRRAQAKKLAAQQANAPAAGK